jgi:hypothetical protein
VDEHVVVFARRLGEQWALVALNNDAAAACSSTAESLAPAHAAAAPCAIIGAATLAR